MRQPLGGPPRSTRAPTRFATRTRCARSRGGSVSASRARSSGNPRSPATCSDPFRATLRGQMVTIGCAGFPVPATRYFKEFLFVEVQETHVTQPGTGTIRRWRREAPPGFSFSMLAPREIGQEGFREGKVTESALKSLLEVGKELDASVAVFVASPDFTASRANK